MEKTELLSTFSGHLDKYDELRGFIDKAKAQEGKFSVATIEKVVITHEIKSTDIGDEIRPLVAEIEAVVQGLVDEIDAVNSKKGSAGEEMEELNLRKVIGELTDKDFKSASKDFKSQLDEAEGRLTDLETEKESFQSALHRWVELALAANHDSGLSSTDGEHGDSPRIREDMSEVIAATDDAARAEPDEDEGEEEEEEIAIEAAEADEGEESVDVDFGFDSDGEEIDILGEDGEDVEIDLVGDQEGEDGAEDGAEDGDDGDEVRRRALLIYQEGTAEEQIYPFTNDVLTIGRGRDNDIQIKNDSKVSRYHCKVNRRGDHFYIEDNKSSNGSLVNGELITERRLFGGEEVIIGETFFRFRIME